MGPFGTGRRERGAGGSSGESIAEALAWLVREWGSDGPGAMPPPPPLLAMSIGGSIMGNPVMGSMMGPMMGSTAGGPTVGGPMVGGGSAAIGTPATMAEARTRVSDVAATGLVTPLPRPIATMACGDGGPGDPAALPSTTIAVTPATTSPATANAAAANAAAANAAAANAAAAASAAAASAATARLEDPLADLAATMLSPRESLVEWLRESNALLARTVRRVTESLQDTREQLRAIEAENRHLRNALLEQRARDDR